jgi:hypothetical protein
MSVPQAQIDELKRVFKGLMVGSEGSIPYFLLPNITLPAHCAPGVVDGLLCPLVQNGYQSRMYYSHQVNRPAHPDPTKRLAWGGGIRILERNWHVLSWQVHGGTSMRLLQMALAHLDAFE